MVKREMSLAIAHPLPIPATETLRVVLADDHAVVLEGLTMVLDATDGIDVVGTAHDVPSALRAVRTRRPDVLVIDLHMPGGSLIDALPQFAAASPETAVVVLTMHDRPTCARAALDAGVRGYVLKEAAASELVHAVRVASRGRTYLDPELGARMAEPPPDGLSKRELDVLRLLTLGYTNAEIAPQLFLSVRTVESYRAHIQQKTGCTTRAELVRYALEHDLQDGPLPV